MFIGRERELASLKEFYDKDGIGMTVIYGRRRIESLRLLRNLSKIKKQFLYSYKSWKNQKSRIVFKTGSGSVYAWDGEY